MKCPKIVCGWRSTQDPSSSGGAYDAPQTPYSAGEGDIAPHSSPLDAFDRYSWPFAGTGREDGHPDFWNVAAPLVADFYRS